MNLTDADAHAFVDDLEVPVLTAEDRHHLERSLRLRPGAPITLADGAGRWRAARFGRVPQPVGPIVTEPVPSPAIVVAFALLKGERNELVVQKLTELGVDAIVPFHAQRCIVRWDGERGTRHVTRLTRVAREAAMQCRRARLPLVERVSSFDDVAARPGAALADGGGRSPGLDRPMVLVGPEGGWAPEELAAGLPLVGLGPHVLRGETAAIAAGALLK